MDSDINMRELDRKIGLIMEKLDIKDSEVDSSGRDPDIVSADKINLIVEKINTYKQESVDPYFTEALNRSLREIDEINKKIDEVNRKVDSNHEVYLRNRELAVQPTTPKEIVKLQVEKPAIEVISDVAGKVEEDKMTIQKRVKRQNESTVEYKVGSELFGFLGAVLILIAMIAFGRLMLPKVLQGIGLFFVPVAILGVGEFFERKYSKKFANTLTATGVATVYIVVLINYMYMETINAFAVVGLSAVITVLSLLLCKKKDNSIIKVISLIGFYISLNPILVAETQADIYVLSVCLVFISCVDLLIKTNKNKAYNYLSLILSFVVIVELAVMATFDKLLDRGVALSTLSVAIVGICVVLSMCLTYFKSHKDRAYNYISTIIFTICFIIIKLMLGNTLWWMAIIHIPVVFYFAEQKKHCKKFYLIPVSIAFIPMIINDFAESSLGILSVLTYLFILIYAVGYLVLISFYKQDSKGYMVKLKILNMIILFITLISGLDLKGVYAFPFIILTIAAILYLDYYKEFTTFISVLVLEAFTINTFAGIIPLNEVDMAIICFDVFGLLIAWLFSNDKRVKAENVFIGYNSIFAINIITFLLSAIHLTSYGDNVPIEAFISYLFTFVLTLGLVFMGTSKNTRIRGFASCKTMLYIASTMVYIVFAPYLPSVVGVILIILLAVLSVYLGFVKANKSLRIFGLGVSLIMTSRLILIDFNFSNDASKVIAYFVTGVLILVISFIYIQLEKTYQKRTKIDELPEIPEIPDDEDKNKEP